MFGRNPLDSELRRNGLVTRGRQVYDFVPPGCTGYSLRDYQHCARGFYEKESQEHFSPVMTPSSFLTFQDTLYYWQ